MKALVTILLFGSLAFGQAWSGVLDARRAVSWSPGIPGGIPSGSYTKCGSTIAAYTGTASTINTQLAGCSANHYVLLGSGPGVCVAVTATQCVPFGVVIEAVREETRAAARFLPFDPSSSWPRASQNSKGKRQMGNGR